MAIKMPAPLADAWLAALRSGEYKKGKGTLKDENGCFCCLGVLQVIADGTVETDAGFAKGAPSYEWLFAHNTQFTNSLGGSTTERRRSRLQDALVESG